MHVPNAALRRVPPRSKSVGDLIPPSSCAIPPFAAYIPPFRTPDDARRICDALEQTRRGFDPSLVLCRSAFYFHPFRTPDDARRICDGGLAHVLNLKLAKNGVLGALEIAGIAKQVGAHVIWSNSRNC